MWFNTKYYTRYETIATGEARRSCHGPDSRVGLVVWQVPWRQLYHANRYRYYFLSTIVLFTPDSIGHHIPSSYHIWCGVVADHGCTGIKSEGLHFHSLHWIIKIVGLNIENWYQCQCRYVVRHGPPPWYTPNKVLMDGLTVGHCGMMDDPNRLTKLIH